jgi:hypothetical protein
MKGKESNCSRNRDSTSVLKIDWQVEDNEQPTPVEVRVLRIDGLKGCALVASSSKRNEHTLA